MTDLTRRFAFQGATAAASAASMPALSVLVRCETS